VSLYMTGRGSAEGSEREKCSRSDPKQRKRFLLTKKQEGLSLCDENLPWFSPLITQPAPRRLPPPTV